MLDVYWLNLVHSVLCW